MTEERAKQLRAIITEAMSKEEDSVVLDNKTLLPQWEAGIQYTIDKKILYNDIVYKVLQSHTSQSDWTPDVAVSLFARVLIPDEDTIPDWEQPDSTNPYMTGDKVRYNGHVYESIIDNNIWSPEAYPAGWKLIEE